MAKPDAQYPVLIWALTIRGEMMAVRCASREEALEIGRENVAAGIWRTWDAFESEAGAAAAEARRIASSEEDAAKAEPPKESIARRRILADWTPPEAPKAPAEVVIPPRAPTVKESLKAYRAAASHQKPKGASHEKEKPKATRRSRIIPE